MIALWTQQARNQGLPKPGFVPPLLYTLAQHSPGTFVDVTTGHQRALRRLVLPGAARLRPRDRLGLAARERDCRQAHPNRVMRGAIAVADPLVAVTNAGGSNMSVRQQPEIPPTPTNGAERPALLERARRCSRTQYGNRFLLERRARPPAAASTACASVDAMRLIGEELVLDGIPMRNLATFVTTWMEPEAQRIIAENLHRNYIDHAEYPQTAEIEQRCIRMLADLFHAPGETTGTRTQGSSEAIMLGALSLKWKWRERREAAGKATDRPNLVFGGDVHVVWEKFCRYFDVEPRIIPLQPDKFTIGPEDVEPHVDENTIGVAAVLGHDVHRPRRRHRRASTTLLVRLRDEKGLDVPLHVDGASGGFVWPFLYPDSAWDFRLEQVRSINVSGHKYGLVYPGIGWLIFRETQRPAPRTSSSTRTTSASATRRSR